MTNEIREALRREIRQEEAIKCCRGVASEHSVPDARRSSNENSDPLPAPKERRTVKDDYGRLNKQTARRR